MFIIMFPRSKSIISRSKPFISSLSRSSSSLSSAPSSSFSIDSVQKTHAYKVFSLYEIEYFPKLDSIPIDKLLFLNPYHINRNPLSSFTYSIKAFIHPPQQKIKEYVQCSRFNAHQFPTTPGEQFVQIGGIRFALTYHTKKGLPITSRIVLVDTRFSHCEHACIRIVQTTFNVGTMMVTMFPNFACL